MGPDNHPGRRAGDDVPLNRYVTQQDLNSVEERLADRIKELRDSGWKHATIIVGGIAVVATVMEILWK